MIVPSHRNISAKEFEKLSEYKDLGMIKRGTQKYVNEIPRNLSLAEIQKILLSSAIHILRRTISL